MNFTVYFQGVTIKGYFTGKDKFNNDSAINIYDRRVGIELLEEFKICEQDVNCGISSVYRNPTVIISGKLAKKSNLFQNTDCVTIQISRGMLNEFMKLKYNSIEKKVENILDEERVIEFWENTGFKTEILTDEDKEIIKITEEKRVTEVEEKKIAEEKKIEDTKKYHEDRKEWILQNGSDYLKDCLELNVPSTKEYIIERAAIEFEGYIVDYVDNANWESKVSPSIEAVEELKRVRKAYPSLESKIILLTKEALTEEIEKDYDYDVDEFQSCEAVIVRGYMMKYDLVKEI